jgi:5-methylthioadenosine/S-adenosylhomocysteine deaminase
MTGPHVQPVHSITASLVYATRASDVQTVIVDGKPIMRDRQLLTLNKAEIIEQVGQSMQRLARRVPSQRIQVYNP